MSWVRTVFRLRTQLGLTQRDIAAAIGVTDQTISNWETGLHEPKLGIKQTQALCRILQCSLDELVEAIEQDENTKPT